MLEMTLILILVVVAMVAIIVNRKSLLACIVITVVAALLGLGFLVLYANADKFATHDNLIKFTITCSVAIIIALLAVTYIGVKMHFKNFRKTGKTVRTPVEPAGEPRLIPGTNVMAKAVGIFGRQPIEKAESLKPSTAATYTKVETPVVREPAVAVRPAVTATPAQTKQYVAVEPKAAPVIKPAVQSAEPVQAAAVEKPASVVKQATQADVQLKRMLEKGEAFKAAGQYVLAEQMYVLYIARCTDNIVRADGELLMLDCRIKAGNKEGAKEQLDDLIGKLRSGEYALTQEQKKMLADCKMNLMRLQ